MRRTRRWLRLIASLATLSVVGCGEEWPGGAREIELLPPETFVWDDQPIAFSPPPEGWVAEREQSGGLFGVRYVKRHSVGERIHVAEFSAVGRRDRCSELASLLDELDELGLREFQGRLQRARPYAKSPIDASEEEGFRKANGRLDGAWDAFREGDLERARERIATAIGDLHWVRYALDEVVAPAIFTGEGLDRLGEVVVAAPRPAQVAGAPARSIDYTFRARDTGRLYHGREVYVEHNNRLFVASFQGLEENLALFDALVASISLLEGPCEH